MLDEVRCYDWVIYKAVSFERGNFEIVKHHAIIDDKPRCFATLSFLTSQQNMVFVDWM
jgi:hypothetical protein